MPVARASSRPAPARALLLSLLLWIAPAAGADGLDDLLRGARERLAAGHAAAAVERLLAHEADYANAPRYNQLLGVAALRAGDFATAVTALRRLTLLRPNDLGARLDLAIAHARMGDATTARRLLRGLAARDDVPPPIRTVIEGQLERLDGGADSRWRFSAGLDTGFGYSSNVNSGTEAERIGLRLDGVPLEVEVAADSRARADTFVTAGTTGRWTRRGRWEPEITARVRREVYARLSDFDNTLASVGAGITGPVGAASQWSLRGRYIHFERRAGDTLRITRLTTRFEHRFSDALTGATAIDLRRDRHRNGARNDGDVTRLRLALGYGRGDWQLGLRLAAGQDEAVAARAGGDQDIASAELRAATRLGDGPRVRAGLQWRREADDEAFSPAFFGATRRETDEYRLRLGARWRLSGRLSAALRLTHSDQRANLDLFDQRTTRFSLGLRWRLQ